MQNVENSLCDKRFFGYEVLSTEKPKVYKVAIVNSKLLVFRGSGEELVLVGDKEL